MNRLKEIARTLARIDEPLLIEKFLGEILTPREVRDLSSRWELVKLLEKGVSQRKIARDLHLSLCKITRGARELKKRNSALKKIMNDFFD